VKGQNSFQERGLLFLKRVSHHINFFKKYSTTSAYSSHILCTLRSGGTPEELNVTYFNHWST